MTEAVAGRRRSLVIAPQWIGDAVMAEPLLAALAAHGDTLTVASLPGVAPVFRAMPQVAAVVELPFAHGRLDWAARRRLGRAWRGQFDAAFVLPNSIKAALLPWLAGVPVRVGYAGEGRPILLNRRLANPQGRPPMVGHYLALAGSGFDNSAQHPSSSATKKFEAAARPRLHVPAAAESALLAEHGLAAQSFWALAPGAEYGPAKRWPAARYAELAARLHRHDGAPIVLLGSPAEAALCADIAATATATAADYATATDYATDSDSGNATSTAAPDIRVLAGRLSLFDSIALIASARGLASNDSGLMHVAAAFGIAQVAIFGSTSPQHTPPLNDRARVLWLGGRFERGCIPCFERQCRYGDTRCLVDIGAGEAASALTDSASLASRP